MSTLALAPIWITTRAAGMGALLCSSGALAAGLTMALKPARLRQRRVELRAAHEALALATFAFIVLHGVALLLDPVLRPGVAGILVPFASSYKRVWTALGQLAAYGMLASGLTFYARRRIGGQRWRRAHRLVPAFWLLAVAHGFLSGTDALAPWFLAAVLLPLLAGGALLAERYRPKRRTGVAAVPSA